MIKNKEKYYWIAIGIALLSFNFNAIAQQTSTLNHDIVGYWAKNSSEAVAQKPWNAQWIWLPDSIKSDVMLARRSFELNDLPTLAQLRITASSKYELYINGAYVCMGPARSAPHHQSYDIFDINPLLKKGKNTIAVKVHHQKGKVSYHLKGRAGLLVQVDFDPDTPSIISNAQWKVSEDPSWDNNSSLISRFQQVVNDRIDMKKVIVHWNSTDFNDNTWQSAWPLLRNSGWPAQKKGEKATTLTTPWTSLVARDIPYLQESNLKATNLIEARIMHSMDVISPVEIKNSISKEVSKQFKGYTSKNEPLVLSTTENNQFWFLLFDFGELINGLPQLNIEGPEGTRVSILSAPYMLDNTFTHRIVDSDFQDEIMLSGKKDNWQSLYFKPARYMAIVIHGNQEAVKIYHAGIHKIAYPFESNGSLSTPEAPWMEALWNASMKTIDVCTTDGYTDNYRERRQYAQTGYYAALGNYWTFGDTALQRRYLIQVAQEQQANGLMPAYAPLAKDDYMVILDSNCLWIRSLYSYLLYSGDKNTVSELLPAAEKLMDLLHTYTNTMGMIDSPPYAYWLDHTLNDRRGSNLCLNGHYLGALNDFSKVLNWMGKNEKSAIYKERAEQLKNSIRNNLWDADKQLFADALIEGNRSNHFSEHANAMALAGVIATKEQGKLIAEALLKKDNHNFIKRENGMTMVSPAMSYFLHKGLAEYGYVEESLQLLNDRFSKMLHPYTNGTLWEEWWRHGTGRTGKFMERTRSDAQTESVFPPDLIAQYVLGLQVNLPGMKEMLIAQPKTTKKQIEATIPSPFGNLTIEWQFNKKNSILKLDIPEGMLVKLNLSTFDLKGNKFVIINDKQHSINRKNEYFTLASGLQKINW